MAAGFEHDAKIIWIRDQVRALEAWREDIARSSVIDISKLTELEAHYAWLTRELARLEQTQTRRVV